MNVDFKCASASVPLAQYPGTNVPDTSVDRTFIQSLTDYNIMVQVYHDYNLKDLYSKYSSVLDLCVTVHMYYIPYPDTHQQLSI